jgi:hypothetical protein
VTFRTAMLAAAERLRSKAGPTGFDIRTSRLTVISRTWSGGRVGVPSTTPGVPAYVDAVLDLSPFYRVRQVNTHEVASSGGRYETGDVLVGPITPSFTRSDGTTGGYSEADLKPSPRRGTETIYRLSGAHAGDYTLIELRSARTFSYKVIIGRRETTP